MRLESPLQMQGDPWVLCEIILVILLSVRTARQRRLFANNLNVSGALNSVKRFLFQKNRAGKCHLESPRRLVGIQAAFAYLDPLQTRTVGKMLQKFRQQAAKKTRFLRSGDGPWRKDAT